MKTSLYITNSSCRRYPNFISKIRTMYYGSMRLLGVVWLVSEKMKIEIFVMLIKITLSGKS